MTVAANLTWFIIPSTKKGKQEEDLKCETIVSSAFYVELAKTEKGRLEISLIYNSPRRVEEDNKTPTLNDSSKFTNKV